MAPRRSVSSVFGLHLLADSFPALHGLRVLAIVSVLQVHVSLTFLLVGFLRADDPLVERSTSVWFGMDLFFVLSGFLIGTLLLPSESLEANARDAIARPRAGILRFYARRSFRIVPLYYVVLTFLAVALPAHPAQRAQVGYEYAYLTNYAPFTVPPAMPWAWSLCVEEHFYLAVPFLAALLARLPRTSVRLGVLTALWLLGLAVRLAVFESRPSWTENEMAFAMYTRTHTRFDVLVAGVMLAYVHRAYGPRIKEALARPGRRFALGLVPLACCAALVGPLAHRHDLSTVFAWGTITSVMYVSLVIVLLNGDDPVTRFLSRRVFLRLATLGYAVYLVHPPIIAHVVAPAAAAMLWTFGLSTGVTWTLSLMLLLVIAALVAWALHVLVEKPALWLRDRLAP